MSDNQTETNEQKKRKDVIWDICPRCGESTRVTPISLKMILIIVWAVSIFSYLFNTIVGIFAVIISVLASITVGIMNIMDYHILKCSQCNKMWFYKEKEE